MFFSRSAFGLTHDVARKSIVRKPSLSYIGAMSQSFENALRKAMYILGKAIERVIGKAKEAKVQVGSRSGTQPILSVESLLDYSRIREIIDVSIQKVMETQMPDLKDKVTLELGEGPAAYGSRLLARQAKLAVAVEIGGASVGMQGDVSRGYIVRSKPHSLPFKDEEFFYILARLATPLQGDMTRAMHEIGRVLTSGGQGVLIDYHPFGLYSRKGEDRLRPAVSGVHRFEDYYRILKSSGLRVVNVREIFVDEGMRRLFDESEIQVYRNLKGTPLIAFLFFYKPRVKTQGM